jgi:hypothetical protein
MSELDNRIHAALLNLLNRNEPSKAVLENALRLLAKHRCKLIDNTLVVNVGTKVQGGPFAGMDYVESATEGCHAPKLLGCYEEELHDYLRGLPGAGIATVLNIGCAEGYYAVGIKRLLPDVQVIAFDIDPLAQKACKALAAKNNVDIDVRGQFYPEDFGRFSQSGGKVLVWCDIEGSEAALLDPVQAPALQTMDLVVELHATSGGHTRDIVPERFRETHDIEIRTARGHDPVLPPCLKDVSDLDRLLAQWEWRSSPTPWAILRPRGRA